MSQQEPIDATNASPIEEASIQDLHAGGKPADPAMAITVALANELQQVYANDQQKLEDLNRSLRAAVKGDSKHKH